MHPKVLKAYFLMLIASLIWGIAANVVKFTLEGIEPIPFLAYRFGITTIIAIPFLLSINIKIKWNISTTLLLVFYGLLSTTISLSLLFLGIDQTTILHLSLVTIIAPLLIEVGGFIVFGEHITKREKIGSTVAILGSILTVLEPILNSSMQQATFYGNLIILGHLTADVIAILMLKKLLNLKLGISGLTITNLSFVIGFISLWPIIAFTSSFSEVANSIITLPFPYHLGVWYMAIFSGTIAYTLRATAHKQIEVAQLALFGYLTPIFSVPLAVLWLGESITPLFLVGATVVAVGVFIAET